MSLRPRRVDPLGHHPDDDPPQRSPDVLRVFHLSAVPPDAARTYVIAVAADAETALEEYARRSMGW